jgi:vacuolar-type H+-ATPase subunit I/STV1
LRTTNSATVSSPASISENGLDKLVIEKIREEEAIKFSQQLQEVIQEKDSVIESLQRKIAENTENTINDMKQAIKGKLLAKIKEVKDEAAKSNQAEIERIKV